jgi:hemerythrin-like domain-containing protein
MKAIDIIHDEHRALAAVLQALRVVLDGIRDQGRAPDFQLLSALVDYIAQVPEKLHHPKEDDHLFSRLRQRRAALAPLLDRLQAQHREGATMIQAVQSGLIRYQAHGPAAFCEFDEQARRYIAFSREHMKTEEVDLLPAAREVLTDAEWAEIDCAFEPNREPWSGPAGEYQALFSRIVSMVPPPYGVGPA